MPTDILFSRVQVVSKRGALLGLLTLITGCGIGDVRDATRYWRRLEAKSVDVTGSFLRTASVGDSAAIAALASDSVVAEVMLLRRQHAVGPLSAAAQQFPDRKKEVKIFGTGAYVSYDYEFEGQQLRVGIWTGFVNNRLVVTRFGSQVWED